MTLKEEILRNIDDVPESSLNLLLQFVRSLRESPVIPAKRETKKRDRPRLLGVLKGQGWMSEDFNEPLELVPESELQLLREAAEHMMKLSRNTAE